MCVLHAKYPRLAKYPRAKCPRVRAESEQCQIHISATTKATEMVHLSKSAEFHEGKIAGTTNTPQVT